MAQNFEELQVWQRGSRLAVDTYQSIEHFTDFSFRDQLRRCSISIPSNIAEGAERNYKQDYIKFLRYSKGSTGELRTQLYIAMKLGLINPEKGNELVAESKELSKMLQGLINSIQS